MGIPSLGHPHVSGMAGSTARFGALNRVAMLVANRGYALTSSRRGYISKMLDAGYTVVVVTCRDKYSQSLVDMGCKLEPVRFNRGGLSPYGDIVSFFLLCRILAKWQPEFVLSFHAKPVIFSSLSLRLVRNDRCRNVSVITGLGHAFIHGGLVRMLAGFGYGLALLRCNRVVFQNADDMRLFLKNGWVKNDQISHIPGSGVDTDLFAPVKLCRKENVVLMLGRLIGQKGVNEFLQVADFCLEKMPDTLFLWAGEQDDAHPDSVSVKVFEGRKNVRYLGRVENVKELLSKASLLLFPSYREGVPRAVMEAASMEVPCVGFDVPGVREVVNNEETGFLVPFKDVEALRDKTLLLLNDCKLRKKLGNYARETMVSYYDKASIEGQYMRVFEDMGMQLS